MKRYLIPFVIFAVALSFKDLLIKQSLVLGQQIALTILFCGVGLALYSFFLSYKDLDLSNISFSPIRFTVNLVGNITMVLSISYLDATTVNVINKSSIPLIILLGGIFGFSYTKKEKLLSALLILLSILYSFIAMRFVGYPSIGFVFFFISLICVSLEFLFLAKHLQSAKNLFELTLPPALAFCIGGGLMFLFNYQNDISYDMRTVLLGGGIAILAGVALAWAYGSSKLRYKYLPPGLADSPTIIAFFVIYALETALDVKQVNTLDLSAALLVMLFSLVLILERAKQGATK